tara:strand:- start:113 stop:439 length:327 start_codon:yes stop_codon:yes gene_type:complete
MLTTDYNQDMTYWANPVTTSVGGISFDAPVALKVRWEERAERFLDTNGEEVVSRAVIWVKEDVDIGGYVYLGSSILTDPTDLDDAYPIRQFFKIPDLRNLFNERRIFL